jgi:uncharacterized protein YecE (DUF72 family)
MRSVAGAAAGAAVGTGLDSSGGRKAVDGEASLAGGAGASTTGTPGTTWVGTAGFSYPDWEGIVVPAGRGARALEHVAPLVRLLEANVSHYRIPAPRTALSWLRRTADLGTRFTAKLHRAFTHDATPPSPDDVRAMTSFLDALASDGRLLAVLAQFPPSFRASSAALARVLALADAFSGRRLAVEFRDASWDRDDVVSALAKRAVAWVVADLPQGPRTIAPRDLVTAPLAYLRLHGKSPDWFVSGVGRDRRYDHLYAEEDLLPWVERVRRLRGAAEDVVVVMNNHFAGKAVVNALQLRFALEGTVPAVPPSLVATYPVLARIVPGTSDPRGEERQGRLFPR